VGASAAAVSAAAVDLRPRESSFFQNGFDAGFSRGADFVSGALGAFAWRENASSFFQKGTFTSASVSGGRSAAETGAWTTTAAAASGTGGSSGAASHGS